MTPEDFGRYVNDNYGKLCGFVRSLGTEDHSAEDVVQDLFLRLLPRCGEINPECPGGFVFAALRHLVIDGWRTGARHGRPERLDDDPPAPPSSPVVFRTDLGAAEERLRALTRVGLATLTPREGKAFAAYWKYRGDRTAALKELGLEGAGRVEKYRVYDGPLHHARRKWALLLKPSSDLLDEIGHDRVWEVLSEELGL